ncbi:type III PLP-dependent enzyme [Oceanospirillum sediminis]|uniref:Type III PLP-dependent enzyme n=1 Tax=Oceanospirillum sediminis TaxID=2760088 RepID=A0A839IL28_9GAMM|nr:type III PLP-dependent enzyme [Oceanospirillum sediminis]MBB1485410.1 type III PLP-dependent enzyme [Oceanospirillum sediminis]
MQLPDHIVNKALELQQGQSQPLVSYIYDLPELRLHLEMMKADLPDQVELFYAVKANPDPVILQQVAEIVDGLEIASGGELELIQPFLQGKPFIFGGPAKLSEDLYQAIALGADLLHIESASELIRLNSLAQRQQLKVPVLLRLNPVLPEEMQTTLTMAGRATAFGIDEQHLADVINLAKRCDWIDLQGFHIHALSHQLEAERHLRLLDFLIGRACQLAEQHGFELKKLNLGGGIGVNYRQPEQQYQWPVFADGLRNLLDHSERRHLQIRFEMGRYLTAFCGYYVMEVLDLKHNHGADFAVCRGGTHQFRLPAAQSHSHPFICIETGRYPELQHFALEAASITVAGQLCTPKDILARDHFVQRVSIGDLLVFPLAGAYAWNISHQNFLCHPAPVFHYLRPDDVSVSADASGVESDKQCESLKIKEVNTAAEEVNTEIEEVIV